MIVLMVSAAAAAACARADGTQAAPLRQQLTLSRAWPGDEDCHRDVFNLRGVAYQRSAEVHQVLSLSLSLSL